MYICILNTLYLTAGEKTPLQKYIKAPSQIAESNFKPIIYAANYDNYSFKNVLQLALLEWLHTASSKTHGKEFMHISVLIIVITFLQQIKYYSFIFLAK